MELNTLLSEEHILRSRVESVIENGKKTAHAKRTQAFFETKSKDLADHWKEYCNKDYEIRVLLEQGSGTDTHPYIAANNFSKIEAKYSEYMGELQEGLRQFTSQRPNTSGQTAAKTEAQNIASYQETALPKIALPKFDGNFDTWRSFHDLFVAVIHNHPRLTPAQKLYYLKTCLTGDAELVLRHTPITDKDYDAAWTKLKDRFANTRILINHQLKTLVNQPKLTHESSKGIKSLIDVTEECMQQLKNLGVDTTSWNELLIFLLVQKLPFATLKEWEEEQGSQTDLPNMSQLKAFLSTRLKILESISDQIGTKVNPPRHIHKTSTTSYHITKEGRCSACNEKHFIPKCPRYRNMTVPDRRKLIQSSGRCFNCLSGTHTIRNCTSKNRCFKCNQLHHTTLHEDIPNTPIQQDKTNPREPSSQHTKQSSDQANSHSTEGLQVTQTFVVNHNLQALLSTAVVIAQDTQGHKGILRCLIDPGSQTSIITEAACSRLRAICTPSFVAVQGIGGSSAATSYKETTLHLQAQGSKGPIVEEKFLVLKDITGPLPRRIIPQRDFQHVHGLRLADSTFWKPGRIDALLGANVYAQILREGIIRGNINAPIAINTLFGWILLGQTTNSQGNAVFSNMAITSDNDLNLQLRKFWEIEEYPSNHLLSQEEAECQAHFTQTHKRLANGRYQVELPFINNETPILGDSRAQALVRFAALQRQFDRNPDFARDYAKCMEEYVQLDHMEMSEATTISTNYYYLPHHAVFKDSSTTKLRIVFDASCRTTNGKSLNDCLMKGPVLQPKLFATLLNWRKYKVAMTADIEKMYRMILVHPKHQSFQRIIWIHPQTKEPQDFQLKTVTFGTSSAPYLAIRTLQQLAKDEENRWPLASKATFKNFYVDDLLTGADNRKDAMKLQTEFIEMMKSAGFKLRKWASNDPTTIEHLPTEDREIKELLTFGERDCIKTLGVQWHPTMDYLTFVFSSKTFTPKPTKRSILSIVASLYDPLGWLAPFLIVAKILIQQLWISGCAWDDPVPHSIQTQWERFKMDLPNVSDIKIPRWIQYTTTTSVQLHGFCDASERAYAAAIYIRTQDEYGRVSTTLLTAKTRVTPTKPTTIPRLELNGALLLARLMNTTINDMELFDVPVYAWTDATIVLQWIKEHPSRWKPYVANRVVEIQNMPRCDGWRHVPTDQNSADLASRGATLAELKDNELWWHGPTWLRKEPSEWPKNPTMLEKTELEARKVQPSTFKIEIQDDILYKYSSYDQLLRIVARILRFINNCKQPKEKETGTYLSSHELRQAEENILRQVQQREFVSDLKNLSKDKALPSNSKLLQLNPFLDDKGIIRVGGRLHNATVPFNQKHPIILPKTHFITSLLIDKLHQETLHGGTSLVLATSRQQFWMLDARRAISSRIHKCVKCVRYRNKPTTQLMGNLPEARVNITRPFAKVGLDYAGPITIKSSPCRKAKLLKAYICLFVCMATKAIHIELVSSLTSEAFIAALKRFVSRRGLCTDMYSDCGTNFIGSKSILDKDLQHAIAESEKSAGQFLTTKQINWHFNPPASPHFGGLWEAGVKSIKRHIKRSLGAATCTFEEYATILSQIESCLNSRPLCYITSEPSEPTILTPGHFLIGQALNAIPEPNYTKDRVVPSQRWKHCQQLLQQFWNKWVKEYLHQLQHRPKWTKSERNIQVGDVVLIKGENVPPTRWPMGVIERVIVGTDGLVRVAEIRTQTGVFRRPIVKLCQLPLDKDPDVDNTDMLGGGN